MLRRAERENSAADSSLKAAFGDLRHVQRQLAHNDHIEGALKSKVEAITEKNDELATLLDKDEEEPGPAGAAGDPGPPGRPG